MGYSPAAIQACFDRVKAAMPQAQLSGIHVDKPGYHGSRNENDPGDYSVQQPYDKKGDPDAGAALDITLHDPADMKRLTQRLIDETKANGDNGGLYGTREFFGCINGVDVTGMDVPGQYMVTSDPSHVWHIHVSGKRQYVNDHAAWQAVADVLLGTTSAGKDDDMPKQMYLYSKSGQTTKLATSGKWYCVGWDADLANTGGSGLSLPPKTAFFSLSAWLYCSGLSKDDNLYWRVQTLDRNNKELAKFPVGEIRGTSGDSDLQFAQVGSVSTSKDTNLRILVAATANNVVIKQAWWRTLYW